MIRKVAFLNNVLTGLLRKRKSLPQTFFTPTLGSQSQAQATPHWTSTASSRRESHHIQTKLSTTEFEDCSKLKRIWVSAADKNCLILKFRGLFPQFQLLFQWRVVASDHGGSERIPRYKYWWGKYLPRHPRPEMMQIEGQELPMVTQILFTPLQ